MAKSLEKVKTNLEIEEHLDAHRQGFAVQKIGLLFILAMVLAGALGVFGDGFLSDKSVSLPFGTVAFQKFHRHEAIMNLSVAVFESNNNSVTVSFPSSYLKSLEIKTITPDVTSVTLKGDQVDYTFAGEASNTTINFSIIPHKVGSVEGQIKVNDAPVHLKHFIYP
jgi:hypothetical protein